MLLPTLLWTTLLLPTQSVPSGGAPAASCDVIGEPASAEDVARAYEGCAAARARFAELLGEPVARVLVVLWREPGYRLGIDEEGRAVLRWPVSPVMRVPAGADAERYIALQWSDVLPHEIAHGLLVARAFPAGFAAHDGYGTPLPDWFEEAVAIRAEPAASRRGRLAQARALPAAMRDLRGIIGGAHPALANRAAFQARDGEPVPADDALWAFYPQSLAVLTFVEETGGTAAVLELKRRLVAGRPPLAALLQLPGLPADTLALEAAWQEWMRPR